MAEAFLDVGDIDRRVRNAVSVACINCGYQFWYRDNTNHAISRLLARSLRRTCIECACANCGVRRYVSITGFLALLMRSRERSSLARVVRATTCETGKTGVCRTDDCTFSIGTTSDADN